MRTASNSGWPGSDPFQGRVGRKDGFVEGDLAVLPTEPAEAGFLPVADRDESFAAPCRSGKDGWPLRGCRLGHADRVSGAAPTKNCSMTSGTSRRSLASADLPTMAERFSSFLASPSRADCGDRTEPIRADVADDAVLNLVLVGLPGVHVAEQLLQQVRGKHLADHVEHLVGAQFAADFLAAGRAASAAPGLRGCSGPRS